MAGIERGTISLTLPLRDSARIVCERYRDLLPDLSSLRIVVPSRHVNAALAREIGAAAKMPALLLPQISTLADWAASVPMAGGMSSDAHRELVLFDALRKLDWVEQHGDLWSVVAELRSLCDDLSRQKIGLPDNLEDWTARLEAAYQARADSFLRYEARLVFEAWRILSAGDTPDPIARYHLQLRTLAPVASGSLCVIGLTELDPAEQDFLDEYAKHRTVLSLELQSGEEPYSKLLSAVWEGRHSEAVPLSTRAHEFANALAKSPAKDRLSFFGAHGLEAEAQAADVAIRTWLLEGKKSIAVVIQDRLVARRLRAILERAQVLVQDETGWTLSTVAAATVVMRLLDCISNDFFHREMLDLLKSPFLFSDVDATMRKATVHALEQTIRQHNFSGGFESLRGLVQRTDAHGSFGAMLARLDGSRKILSQAPASTSQWLDRLSLALHELGVSAGLLEDMAGQQVLELLARLSEEVAPASAVLSLSEWRRWLDAQFERENFRDRDVVSVVLFTHLAATQMRSFDAVVLLGADASHLPTPTQSGPFLNDAVRHDLGLPTSAQALTETRSHLLGLLARSASCLVTWQNHVSGEENLLSPWLEVLQTFHHAAYGAALPVQLGVPLSGLLVDADQLASPMPQVATAPAPQGSTLMPKAISVSAYKSAIDCPYQFFARHLLRLNPTDEVRETMDKRDYGEILHRVLREFHERFPQVSAIDEQVLTQVLIELSERAFAKDIESNFQASMWLIEWSAIIPEYIRWQRAREGNGWEFVEGEVRRETPLWDAADAVHLRGRLDRVDRRPLPDGRSEFAILDYKAKDFEKLRTALKLPGEEVQLSAYAVLHESAELAQYVCLHDEKVGVAPAKEPLRVDADAERTRATTVFKAIIDGARLPAQGDDDACRYCDASGLCRRLYWK